MSDAVQSYFDQMLDTATADDALEPSPTPAESAASPHDGAGAVLPRAVMEAARDAERVAGAAGAEPPDRLAGGASGGGLFPTVAQLEAVEAAAKPSEQVEWVIFELDEQCYALDVHGVREIVRPPAMETVPHAPDSLRGVANMRGAVIAIFDTSRLLGRPAREPQPASRVIIIEHHDDVLGLFVDRVHEILRFEADEAEDPPPLGATARHVVQVLRQPGRLVQRLDPASLFQ